MSQVRVDWGVLQGTKLTKGVYKQEYSGFWVMATEAPSAHRGGVTIFYRKVEHFSIKELRLQGLNVISFNLVTLWIQWHVLGCYITPSNA